LEKEQTPGKFPITRLPISVGGLLKINLRKLQSGDIPDNDGYLLMGRDDCFIVSDN